MSTMSRAADAHDRWIVDFLNTIGFGREQIADDHWHRIEIRR